MKWYAAHLLVLVKTPNSVQEEFHLWENIVLVGATSSDEAWAKADALGKNRYAVPLEKSDITLDGQKACHEFCGIRRLVQVDNYEKRPGDGSEITYLRLEVSSQKDVQRLLDNEPITLIFDDLESS